MCPVLIYRFAVEMRPCCLYCCSCLPGHSATCKIVIRHCTVCYRALAAQSFMSGIKNEVHIVKLQKDGLT